MRFSGCLCVVRFLLLFYVNRKSNPARVIGSALNCEEDRKDDQNMYI